MDKLGTKYLEILKAKEGQQFDPISGACLEIEPISIGKDIYGRECNMHELHEIILKIILEIDRICRKNNIDYALAFGSTLGIYNYKGFFPWDDDADIAIKYEDISRFIEAIKKDLSPEFALDCYEEDNKYNVLIPTMKIRYVDSYIKEFNSFNLPNKCENGDGVFVDVVALMNVPNSIKEHKKLLRYAKNIVPLYWFLDSLLRINPKGLKKKIKNYENKVFDKYHDKTDYISQTVIIPWQDYKMENDSLKWKKDIIYPFKEYEFEGHKLYSFNDIEAFIDTWFKAKAKREFINGKWCDPYPQNKRKMEHIKEFLLTKKK